MSKDYNDALIEISKLYLKYNKDIAITDIKREHIYKSEFYKWIEDNNEQEKLTRLKNTEHIMNYTKFLIEYDKIKDESELTIELLNDKKLLLIYKVWGYNFEINDYYISKEFNDLNFEYNFNEHSFKCYTKRKIETQNKEFDRYLHCLPIDMNQSLEKISEKLVLQFIYKQYTKSLPEIIIIPNELLQNIENSNGDNDKYIVSLDGAVIDNSKGRLYYITLNNVDLAYSLFAHMLKETHIPFQENRILNALIPLNISTLIRSFSHTLNNIKLIQVCIITDIKTIPTKKYLFNNRLVFLIKDGNSVLVENSINNFI